MLVEDLTTYESWDLEKPPVPSRSRLYHLEPICVGTPYVESLTGYIARLAEAHCVLTNTLFAKELAPLVGKTYSLIQGEYSALAGKFRKSTKTMNGMGVIATDWVQALEMLTLQRGFRFLTMLTWAEAISVQRLLRPIRAWCPACYEEWRVSETTVYEPLLWTLNVVEMCPRHHRRLRVQCPHCDQQLPLLAQRSRPGYCSKCGEWLGICPNAELTGGEALTEDELKWLPWAVDTVGELIAAAPRMLSLPSREKVTAAIRACVNQVTDGNASAFGHMLQVDEETVRVWLAGKKLPQLNSLLRICYSCGTSILNFMTEEVVVADLGSKTKRFDRQLQGRSRTPLRGSPFNLEQVRHALQAALNKYPPPSLKEVVRLHEYRSYTTLYKYFPDICRAISARHADYQKGNRLEKMQRILLSVLESDEYPPSSMRKVAQRADINQRKLYEHFPDLCRAISARYTSYLKVCSVARTKQLCFEVRQVTDKLVAAGVEPTARRVAELLTKPGAIQSKEVQEALREVRAQLGWEKKLEP